MRVLENLDAWLEKAADTLTNNRIHIDGYRYTAPSLDTGDFGRKDYANQFMWDSCYHAIILRWIDPVMAQDELIALMSRQLTEGADAGMIPHCNYWRGGGEWLWIHGHRSSITAPPIIALAAKLVYERSADRSFLELIYPKLSAYHDWFDRRRDPDKDGLACIIHPWEAGGDALPRWDKGMGFDQFTHETGREARIKLADVIVKYDTDPVRLAEEGYFHVEPMDFNSIRAADMEAMSEMAQIVGKPDEAANWLARVNVIREAFQRKMIIDGRPYDLAGIDEQPIIQDSTGQFVTMLGGLPTPEQADTLVKQLQQDRFWTPFPVPTSPTDLDSFAPDTYWRGNVWPFANWLIHRGLKRYGYDTLADALAECSFAILEQSGFWEYYHPITGQGLGGQTFSWGTVMLDMATAARGA